MRRLLLLALLAIALCAVDPSLIAPPSAEAAKPVVTRPRAKSTQSTKSNRSTKSTRSRSSSVRSTGVAMTLDQLRQRLADAGVRPDACAFDDPHVDQAYALLREADEWAVFYSERGQRNDEQRFTSESLAADHLYALVTADPTTHG